MIRHNSKVILIALLSIMVTDLQVHAQDTDPEIISRLEVYTLADQSRQIIYEETGHFEAPNWGADSTYFVINQAGKLYTLSSEGKYKSKIPIVGLQNMNNDHGISPDGTILAISNNDPFPESAGGTSRIYTVPIQGGVPKRITPLMPSYWHGWNPDGKSVVYTAQRNGVFDIYSIDLHTAQETRITNNPSLDDGPEFSHDGTYLYFNSFRSGSMEIWRIHWKSKALEQLTDDAYSNWFPHPSPDGKYLVFLSYEEDQGERHPSLKKVQLRIFDLETKNIHTAVKLLGGQGTINVPSWSPDSRSFAFVSYELK